MPVYEYQCKKCKKVIEVVHKVNDKPEVLCPKCGSKTKKIISLNAFTPTKWR